MLKKYFDDALLLEEKGYKFYKELEREASNQLSKMLFESLAKQEQYHIDSIKSYVENAQYQEIKFDSIEENIHNLFNKLGKEMIGKDLAQIEGLEKAMKMEKEGYALYKQAYDSATTDEDKKFLEKLINMENEHYEGLANLHYFYTSNDQWLSEDEAKVWNWMNF